MSNCEKCQGLIMGPRVSYGYAGKVCQCNSPLYPIQPKSLLIRLKPLLIEQTRDGKEALTNPHTLAMEEALSALEILIAAKKQKDQFGKDDNDYKQLKSDGWHKASIAIASLTKALGR